jgi:hypothetical protein
LGHPVVDELLARCGPGALMAGAGPNLKGACDVLVIDSPPYEAHSVGLRLVKYAPLAERFIVVGVPAQFSEVAGTVPGVLRVVDGEPRPVEVTGVLPAVRGWLKKVVPLWRPVAYHDRDGLGVLVLERDAPVGAAIDIGTVPSVPPPELAPRPPGGIGTELTELLAGYGLDSGSLPKLPEGCSGCKDLAQQMDLGGADFCALHREAILGQLDAAYKGLGWGRAFFKAAGVAARSYLTPGAFHINPVAPAASLLDEATRRWLAKFRAWEAERKPGAGAGG